MMSGSQFMSEQRANNLNPLLAKQAAVTIKQVPQEKLNHVKKKSEPNKDEVKKTAKTMLEEYLTNGDVNEAIATLKELNAPLKFLPEVVSDMMLSTIIKTDDQRETVMQLILAMKQENLIKSTTFMDVSTHYCKNPDTRKHTLKWEKYRFTPVYWVQKMQTEW